MSLPALPALFVSPQFFRVSTLQFSSPSSSFFQTSSSQDRSLRIKMKYSILLAGLATVSSVLAAPEKRWCLTDSKANTIVAKFQSVLEGVDYNGQSPNITAKQVVAKNYIEYSDSILSLEGAPVSHLRISSSDIYIRRLTISLLAWQYPFRHLSPTMAE